jgi:hypothetical protein
MIYAVLGLVFLTVAVPHSIRDIKQPATITASFLRCSCDQTPCIKKYCKITDTLQSLHDVHFNKHRMLVLRGGGDADQNGSNNPFETIFRSLSTLKSVVESSVKKYTSLFRRKGADKAECFRSCTVTQANFDTACVEIESLLSNCSFYSLDCEMTSLDPSDWHPSLQVGKQGA